MVEKTVKDKLKELPDSPGVYFHKDKSGDVIYIGKAAVLKNRVRQYFQKSRNRDPKTEALVAEITDVEWIVVETEIDALFLEAEMVRRYLPRYNILLRDDKSLSYVRIDIKSDHPTVTLTRRPLDDKAEYFGPYISGYEVKKALRLLRRIFPYAVTQEQATMGSKLYEQIGLDPGLKSGRTSLEKYRQNLRLLMSYLRGNRTKLMREIEKEMKLAASEQNFELAATLRNKISELKSLKKQVVFSDREFMDISKDKGLQGLANLLSIDVPKRIEGYDISHMGGRDVVASQVVFTNGLPDKKNYRKYKIHKQQNNDFASMANAISRRLSPKNVKSWGIPNLILIDGGKGQLSSAIEARNNVADLIVQGSTLYSNKLKAIPMIGLAKREEEIVVHKEHSNVKVDPQVATKSHLDIVVQESGDFQMIRLGQSTDLVKLLQRIRDESHRFAVSYHSTLKSGRQTTSWLDNVPTIGPATKKKLIKHFGSSRGVIQARKDELESLVGDKKATVLRQYIRAEKKM